MSATASWIWAAVHELSRHLGKGIVGPDPNQPVGSAFRDFARWCGPARVTTTC
jgi:hypothetical protein